MDFSLPKAEIEELAGGMDDRQAELLSAYAESVVDASERVNLVSRRSIGDLAEHLVDSAALLSFLEAADVGTAAEAVRGELADLGTGAGLPGVVIAVLRPEVQVVLVDSRRSKVVFLKDVKRRLDLENVEIVHQRLEELRGRRAFHTATARALGSVEDVLPHCLRLVAPGGRLVLFKGPGWEDERPRAEAAAENEGAAVARAETVALPGLDRRTTFVEFHVKRVDR